MSGSKVFTLRELELLARTEQEKISLGRMMLHLEPDPYDVFVKLVDRAITFVVGEITTDPSSKQGMSEDELTEFLRLGLKSMGFNATHDTKTGGHCDIVIEEHGDLRWLGEAKMVDKTDSNWLFQGYLQLTTRYTNGRLEQAHGGMIIYSYIENTVKMMATWQKYLLEKQASASVHETNGPGTVFTTKDVISSSGTDYFVKHIPVQLYFNPLH
ncbi:hypothetical protein [Rhizobium leguminosarum]|uniref:hypothetical protein n=1 Tax=Rhizobium leguminosarum TaxID=384 RepID=UPI003F963A17